MSEYEFGGDSASGDNVSAFARDDLASEESSPEPAPKKLRRHGTRAGDADSATPSDRASQAGRPDVDARRTAPVPPAGLSGSAPGGHNYAAGDAVGAASGSAPGSGSLVESDPAGIESASDADSDSDADSCASNPVDGPMMYHKSFAKIVRELYKDEDDPLPGLDHRSFVANVKKIMELHPGIFDGAETEHFLWLHVICNQYARAKGLCSAKWESLSNMSHWYVDGKLNRYTGAATKKKKKRGSRLLDLDLSGFDEEQLEVRNPNLLLGHEFLEEVGKELGAPKLAKHEGLARTFEVMCFAEHKLKKKFEPKLATHLRKRYATYEFHKDDKKWMRDVLFQAMARTILSKPDPAAGSSGSRASAGIPAGLSARGIARNNTQTSFHTGGDRSSSSSDLAPAAAFSPPGPGGVSPRFNPIASRTGRGGMHTLAEESSSVLSGGGYGDEPDEEKQVFWGNVLEEDLQIRDRLDACPEPVQKRIMRILESSDLEDCVDKLKLKCGGHFHRRFRGKGRPKRVDGKSFYTEADRPDMVEIAKAHVTKTLGKYLDLTKPITAVSSSLFDD